MYEDLWIVLFCYCANGNSLKTIVCSICHIATFFQFNDHYLQKKKKFDLVITIYSSTIFHFLLLFIQRIQKFKQIGWYQRKCFEIRKIMVLSKKITQKTIQSKSAKCCSFFLSANVRLFSCIDKRSPSSQKKKKKIIAKLCKSKVKQWI